MQALGEVENKVPAVTGSQAVDQLPSATNAIGLMAEPRKAESMASTVATPSNSAVSSAE